MHFLFGGVPLTAGAVIDSMGTMPVMNLRYPVYNLVVIAIGVASAVFLWAVIYRTRFGVILRATSQNMRMASALGVNVKWVFVQAFALGCFMAGLGGAVVVPAQAAVLGMGVEALILAFVVVVIGGLGSLEGALIGALIVSLCARPASSSFPKSNSRFCI
jgi:branched-chain amino acid transport system permease protein